MTIHIWYSLQLKTCYGILQLACSHLHFKSRWNIINCKFSHFTIEMFPLYRYAAFTSKDVNVHAFAFTFSTGYLVHNSSFLPHWLRTWLLMWCAGVHIKLFVSMPGSFICFIKMDRMNRQLAAKAAQEEAGKHTHTTYVAIEAVANFNNLSSCCVHALPRRRSCACALAQQRQCECDPSLKHCRFSCHC